MTSESPPAEVTPDDDPQMRFSRAMALSLFGMIGALHS